MVQTLRDELMAQAAQKPRTLRDELMAEAQAPTPLERVGGGAANLLGGLAGTVSDFYLKGSDLIGRKIASAIVGEEGMAPAGSSIVGRAGKAVDEGLQSLVPESVKNEPEGAGRFFTTTVPRALGSTAGYGLAAAGTGLVGAAYVGAVTNGSAGYYEALASGASEDTAWTAFLLNAGVGTSEALPIGRILARATGGAAGSAIRSALLSGSEEWAQETGQQALGNLIAQNLYDEDRKVLEGVLEAGGAGAFSGVLLSALGSGIAARGRSDQRKPLNVRSEDPTAARVPGAQREGISRDLTGSQPPPNAGDVAQLEAQPELTSEPAPSPVVDLQTGPQATPPHIAKFEEKIASGKLDQPLVDETGQPLVLYRGEPSGMEQPMRAASGGAAGPGTYFSVTRSKAETFAGPEGTVHEVTAPDRRILRLPIGEDVNARDWNAFARARGYDGIWVSGHGEVVLFEPPAPAPAPVQEPTILESVRAAADVAPAMPKGEQIETDEGELPEQLGAPALPGGGISIQPAEGESKIGANMAGRLEEGTSERVSAPQVVESLAKVMESAGMKTPIRTGFVNALRGKAQGVFKVRPEVVRMKVANDIAVAAHEVAHAFEKQVFGLGGAGIVAKSDDAGATRELIHLGTLLYGNKPQKLLRAEGFAEFVRLYMTNDTEAKARAPQFFKWFDTQFLPGQPEAVRSSIATAKQAATTWRMQGSRARASESIVDKGASAERVKKIAHKASRFLSFEAHVDALDPLATLSKEAAETKGSPLATKNDPHAIADALRLTHDARTEQMVSRSMIDLAGNPIGPSLREVVKPIQGRYRDFTLYLVAKRAKALWTDAKHGARNPGLSQEDADQLLKELGSPEFEAAAQGVYGWYDGVLDYAAEASPEFASIADKIRAADPGSYIPLQRVFDEAEQEFMRRKDMGVSAQGGSLSARLKGSGRQIKDPFPEMIAKARRTVLQAHQRMVLDAVLDLSKLEGFGHLVEGPLPKGRVPMTVEVEQAIRALEQLSGTKMSPDTKEALAGETLTFFVPAQKTPKGADPIFPVYRDGKVQWYQLDERLFRSLTAMDAPYLHPFVDATLGASARAFRLGTTGLRASFSLVTNPLRDLQTFYLNTQSRRLAAPLLANWFTRMARAAGSTLPGVEAEPAMQAWVRLGGQMAQSLGQDVPHTRRAARQLFQGPVERVLLPANLYDGIRDLFQFPESVSRTAELVEVGKRIGWKPGELMTLTQSLELLRAGKQVTTDFSAAGNFARLMNQIVPFYNAAIQGPRAAVRSARRNPAQFAIRAGQLAAVSLLLWWSYKDEEWYTQKDAREKFGFWYFPFERNGELELVKIPRGQEVGAQTALVEALADAWYREDPKAVTEFMSAAFQSMQPLGLPPLAEETVEQLANVDTFTGAPVVPQYGAGSLQAPDAEQFSDYTSRAAVALGEAFNVSPRRIDHAIRGVGGPVASDLFELLGLGPPEVERESEPADAPVVGRLFERGGAMGTRPRAVGELYDALEDAQKRQHSKREPETEDQRQLRLILDDATKAVSALSAVRQASTQIKVKREAMREAVSIANDALAQVKAGNTERGKARQARKDAERREEAIDSEPPKASTQKP